MSNAYLLLNYSFSYEGNKYDSYVVNLEIEPTSLNVEDLICFDFNRMKGIETAKL